MVTCTQTYQSEINYHVRTGHCIYFPKASSKKLDSIQKSVPKIWSHFIVLNHWGHRLLTIMSFQICLIFSVKQKKMRNVCFDTMQVKGGIRFFLDPTDSSKISTFSVCGTTLMWENNDLSVSLSGLSFTRGSKWAFIAGGGQFRWCTEPKRYNMIKLNQLITVLETAKVLLHYS